MAIFLAAGSSTTRRERQLTCARHYIDSARDLRIGIVEYLRRSPVSISR
jgi:hypothetical protein